MMKMEVDNALLVEEHESFQRPIFHMHVTSGSVLLFDMF